jgi:hypothetical protein
MIAGLYMMSGFGGFGGFGRIFTPFMFIWIVFGLIGAGVSFYNAFSDKGVPIYEIDRGDRDQNEREQPGRDGEEGTYFCSNCGRKIHAEDRFCKYCGHEQN